MQEAVEHGGDRGVVAEQLAPVLDGAVGGAHVLDAVQSVADRMRDVAPRVGGVPRRRLGRWRRLDSRNRRSRAWRDGSSSRGALGERLRNRRRVPGNLSTNGSDICMFSQQMAFVIVGSPTAPVPTTVADGDTQAGAPVHVSCSVKASGDGFDVAASATVDGLNGGALTFSGHVTTMGGTGLAGSFNNAENGTFAQASAQAIGCTITYTGDPQPAMPAVAPGRIWGHIDCEDASRSNEVVSSPNGMLIPRTSDGFADFLFENCGS